MRKTVFWGGIFILLAFLFLFRQDELTRQLNVWQIKMDLAGFKQVNISKDATKTSIKEELEAKREDTTLRISKTKVADHKKFIEDKKFLLQSLFEPTTSPYPEVITNVVSCPEEFKPRAREVTGGTVFSLFAGERFNYGICAKDLIKYNSVYGIFDCRQKGVFEIKIFGDDEQNLQNLINTFTC